MTQTQTNPELQLAFDFVENTNTHVFLTGKAGTGKTTFLHDLKKKSPKRMIVVAPTGVAAMNAGGVTIHSFFQMPFGPQIPGNNAQQQNQNPKNFRRMSREKKDIMKSMDLLVIDEISMVRSDLLDGIDQVLRQYKDREKPFGGVQLLMIGDLQQLAPVVKEEEWSLLQQYYSTAFFFGSHALQKTSFVSIELKRVYRQSDQTFVELLNNIRDHALDTNTIQTLNKRYDPALNQFDKQGYISLTTHNAQAQRINEKRLQELDTRKRTFTARVQGDFPEYTYPTEYELTLKKGAQVMFVKNDPSAEKMYFNGKIGVVESFDTDTIYVQCPGEPDTIPVEKAEWENTNYTIDEETKEIKENVTGRFNQYPLKLAWAITIHKSQGLTFDKAIIDANAAFAHGQVYVALSRCRSLEGLILSKPLSAKGIISDHTISAFTTDIQQNPPDRQQLEKARQDYEKSLILDLFNFNRLQKRIGYARQVAMENRHTLIGSLDKVFDQMLAMYNKDIFSVFQSFSPELHQLINQHPEAQQNAKLQERLKKAAGYFQGKLETIVLHVLKNMTIETDNRTVRKSMKKAVDYIDEEAKVKQACFSHIARQGFTIVGYLNTKGKASLEEATAPKPAIRSESKTEVNISLEEMNHPEMFNHLKAWRHDKATGADLPYYMILPQKAMITLAEKLPTTVNELKMIKGIGNKKIEQFGDEWLELIHYYRAKHDIKTPFHPESSKSPSKEPKKDTKTQSLVLFRAGKDIESIADERGLVTGTIISHLTHFVGTGDLQAEELLSAEKINLIETYFRKHPDASLSEAKEALMDDVSYNDLKIVRNHMQYNANTINS
ncbi:MAG: AAA family ATPase [Bacteroidetes bacterium]|jgi:hypothetical protein|nr:AAA family ATPase [Bacteroidota bacterium]